MKTIKFKCWDRELRRFVIYEPHISIDLNGNILNLQNGDGKDRYELAQYTGLLDKWGKEIYEGDIVKYGTDDPSPVIFDNQMFCVPVGGSDHKTHLHIMGGINKWEVIGNVFENSELLNQ
jgi:hypothetical protein